MSPGRSFTRRLVLALAGLLMAYAAWLALVGQHLYREQEQESLQRLSRGLAGHIVEHWPEITLPDRGEAELAARRALLGMLMTVNPGVQVYLLDADGQVQHYIGPPGMVRQQQVDLAAVRAFLAGAALPLRGTDPMGTGVPRIFSAAMFPPQPGERRPPGYLYVMLDSPARHVAEAEIGSRRLWQGAALAAAAGLLVTLGLGLFTFQRLTRPLQRLAQGLRSYQRRGSAEAGPAAAAPPCAAEGPADEVQALAEAFAGMRQRIDTQAERERRQAADHREMMASVAHDLRTPLTALHGHLEALAGPATPGSARGAALLEAALAQSRKVGRLSQQLFELAALQSTAQVLHRERFCLDELVTDAVQKFRLGDTLNTVTLDGPPPGRVELEGDLQLIERALTNLIDNALRHGAGSEPVRVSLHREGSQAHIMVEDSGTGLPQELAHRLAQGLSLRDPPIQRSAGGIGGLGLAIAQRVAVLHGGSLRPLPGGDGGARLCLVLPLRDGGEGLQ